MKTRMAVLAAALALVAWLRPAARVEGPAAVARSVTPPGAAAVANPAGPVEPGAFDGEASARGELRALEERRQLEWAVEVDQQTRLEWTERYDAERKALLDRLSYGKP